MWTWNLSSPGLSPSWANWISNSSSSFFTGSSHTEQRAPTPGPPQVRSGRLAGSFPLRTAARAFSRRIASSGIYVSEHPAHRETSGRRACIAGRNSPDARGPDARLRQPQSPVEGRVTIAQTLGKLEQGGSRERVVTDRNRVGREWRNWQTRWT